MIRISLLLVLAALLEAGGDAVIRRGLQGRSMLLLACGGVILLAYGVAVNSAPWNFGRLLGGYVAIFFVLAQVLDLFVFGHRPSWSILAGGALVVAGGLVVLFGEAGLGS